MTNARVEWVRSVDMAEFAEVLGIPTNYIFAVNPAAGGEEHLVVYTPDWPNDETLWAVLMQRDADGILHKTSVPRARPGLWEEIKASVEKRLGGGDDA